MSNQLLQSVMMLAGWGSVQPQLPFSNPQNTTVFFFFFFLTVFHLKYNCQNFEETLPFQKLHRRLNVTQTNWISTSRWQTINLGSLNHSSSSLFSPSPFFLSLSWTHTSSASQTRIATRAHTGYKSMCLYMWLSVYSLKLVNWQDDHFNLRFTVAFLDFILVVKC